MPDSRFYRAITARARCEAGQFVLMGRTLRVFTLAHFAVLEELIGDDLYEPAPDLATLDILSRVCEQRRPGCNLADLNSLDADALERYHHSLLQFHLAHEQARWSAYFDACYLSRPRTRSKVGGATLDLRAPFALIISTYLLRHLHGITRDELWHDWPLSEVLWQYESAKEQINEETTLAESDEPDPEPTPEEKLAEEKHTALAAKIFARADARHREHPDHNAPAHREIEAEKIRLLQLAASGKLDDDLNEISEEGRRD